MIHYLFMGVVLGLSAGLAPGPLLTLVVSETLAHDVRAGIRVALAPMISDLPIVLVTLFVLSKLSQVNGVLGIISLVGGCLIFMMGFKGLKSTGVVLDMEKTAPRSLSKGVVVNLLSPHPYLFWISVGGPAVTGAMEISVWAVLAYVGGFYVFLMGSKVGLALLVGKSKTFLKGRAYRYTMKALGAVLCGLALVLFREGLILLGVMGP